MPAPPSSPATLAAGVGALLGGAGGAIIWGIFTTRTVGAGLAVIGSCATAYALLAVFVTRPDRPGGAPAVSTARSTAACRTVLPGTAFPTSRPASAGRVPQPRTAADVPA